MQVVLIRRRWRSGQEAVPLSGTLLLQTASDQLLLEGGADAVLLEGNE